jgi:alpha-tubulin suppressor-like RCC1 family protein
VVYTWGRNEHWQLGYEVSGLLNSGHSFDAQPEPAPVPLPEGTARVVDVACGELGTAVLLADDSVRLWENGVQC